MLYNIRIDGEIVKSHKRGVSANVFLNNQKVEYIAGGCLFFIPIDSNHAYKVIRPDDPHNEYFGKPTSKDVERIIEIQKIYFKNDLSINCSEKVISFEVKWKNKLFRTYGYKTSIAKNVRKKIPEDAWLKYVSKIKRTSSKYNIVNSVPDKFKVNWREVFKDKSSCHVFECTRRRNVIYNGNVVYLVDIDRGMKINGQKT
jgi:hypothetical protein